MRVALPLLDRDAVLVRLTAAAALGAILAGCVAAGPPTIGGYPTTYAQTVPPGIYGYPHVWYAGGYAYLVGDRWYYPTGRDADRWVVLEREPPELYRYRGAYRPPPPAYRPPPPYYGYPPR
jgi:hypothetical protein